MTIFYHVFRITLRTKREDQKREDQNFVGVNVRENFKVLYLAPDQEQG